MKGKPLDTALRKNRGARIMPEWMLSFRRITGISLTSSDFLPLEETDSLRNVFAKSATAPGSVHSYWPAGTAYAEIERTILRLAEQRWQVVLFHRDDVHIGALVVPLQVILEKAQTLREFLGGDISLMTKDAGSGLCLEQTFYNEKGEYVTERVWELTVWGLFAEALFSV